MSNEKRKGAHMARIVTLILAVIAWLGVLALVLCIVPVFGEMFADFGATLPLPTEVLISGQGRAGLVLLVTTVIALLISQQVLSSRSARCIIVNVVAMVLPLLFVPLVVLTMFLPIFRMGEIVSQ